MLFERVSLSGVFSVYSNRVVWAVERNAFNSNPLEAETGGFP